MKVWLLGLLLVLPAWAAAENNPRVTLHTSKGDIVIELYPDKAPVTVENFLRYAGEGFYEDTVFHRVIPRFMIQGGGFTAELEQKPTHAPIVNEADNRLRNTRWSVAMARTDDPDSATSQFFINLRLNLDLDRRRGEPGYTVFGEVIEGQHVVRDISHVETGTVDEMRHVPLEPVVIQSVTIERSEP